ncbi:hypothetical protein VTO73DRAFT_4644 [Trametes versicolor]
MPPPPIPVELIEHAISFLRGNTPSLAACSLTCRALLPISRVQLWHKVELSVQSDGLYSLRTEAFKNVITSNPDIASYVDSLVILPTEPSSSRNVPSNGEALITLCTRLPALRSLRLRRLSIQYLYDVVPLIRDLPNLESLYLDRVSPAGAGSQLGWLQQYVQTPNVGPVGGSPPVWGLRKLSITGGATIRSAEVTRLAHFLEWAKDSELLPRLETLNFCSPVLPSVARGGPAAPGIPSFAPSLRHFGILLCDLDSVGIVPEGPADNCYSSSTGQHVERVMSGLSRCSALRSLYLRYDCRSAHLGHAAREQAARTPLPHSTPTPFFLDRLADVLSTPGPAPLPLLEKLTLIIESPAAWIVGSETVFARLADALIGDAEGSQSAQGGASREKRYPRFSHLRVRTSCLPLVKVILGDAGVEEERERQEADRVRLIVPMLARFVQAGVHVEVVCG